MIKATFGDRYCLTRSMADTVTGRGYAKMQQRKIIRLNYSCVMQLCWVAEPTNHGCGKQTNKVRHSHTKLVKY